MSEARTRAASNCVRAWTAEWFPEPTPSIISGSEERGICPEMIESRMNSRSRLFFAEGPQSSYPLSARQRERTMTTRQNKTALVTGASRGNGRATALALARGGRTFWFTMCVLRRKVNLSSPRSKRKADVQMQSRRIWNFGWRFAARQAGALHRWRSIGCACAQRRNW
jgi:hypothetical protein